MVSIREGVLAVAASIAMLSASIATAEFASDVPDSWDIRGLTIGMTVPEAEAAILSALGVDESRLKRLPSSVDFGNEKVSYQVTAKAYANKETIAAHFTAPPGEPRAVMLARDKTYAANEGPSLENLISALNQKYGEPLHTYESGSRTQLTWQVGTPDFEHRKICLTAGVKDAGMLKHRGNVGLSNKAHKNRENFSYCLVVNISASPGKSVSKIVLGMVDMKQIKASGAETAADKEQADAAQQQADQGAASSRIPEL